MLMRRGQVKESRELRGPKQEKKKKRKQMNGHWSVLSRHRQSKVLEAVRYLAFYKYRALILPSFFSSFF